MLTTSPGRYAGQDNGWVAGLIGQVMLDFDKTIIKYPEHQALPGRRLERPRPGPSASGESAALAEGPAGRARRR